MIVRSVVGSLVPVLLSLPALGQTTTRMSVDSSGAQGNQGSFSASLSADGRFVAFQSGASNLVAGDTNGASDVFVRELSTGTTSRVSVGSGGAQANSASHRPSLSADGRYVAFTSAASDLVVGDTNARIDVFVHDRVTLDTTRVSVDSAGVQANDFSALPSISGDGRFVAFESRASNLVAGDTNVNQDIFVHDRQTGATIRASVNSAGVAGTNASYEPSISGDGRYLAFSSDALLGPGDINGTTDIFLRDLVGGVTTRVSRNDAGEGGNGTSWQPEISADGRFVAFASAASNLVPGDVDGGLLDIFVHDRLAAAIRIVSVDSNGIHADHDCGSPTISADGRFVAFDSLATNLFAGDTNGFSDVFVHDTLTGLTTCTSLTWWDDDAPASSYAPALSADGRRVGFESSAWTLVMGDTNVASDVFLRDLGPAALEASCFGDGSQGDCPCSNSGQPGRGCENSSSTGGAQLTGTGATSLSADGLVLTASGERPTALSVFLQGSLHDAPLAYGDGLRCAGGLLKRLYVKNAVGGTVTAPQGADPSVSVRSAALGDPIPMGATRHYQTYYRDATPSFCPAPAGNTFNVTNAVSALWSP